jgi:hypothetical protein
MTASAADFSGDDVTEFRILNFIDRLSHRGTESCAVTLDLPQSVIAGASELASIRSKRSKESILPSCVSAITSSIVSCAF